MYIEKSSGPNIDPWEMPVCTGAHWMLTVKNYSLLSAITKKTQTIWVVFLKYQEFQVYVKDLMSHVIKSFWNIQKIASSQVMDYDQNLTKYYELLIKVDLHKMH